MAILLVFFFHAFFGSSSAHVFYQLPFGEFPIFKYGWVGVDLFFLISGFVILMTLEKSESARQFLYRRWLRLFPAMLICTFLIFATAPLFLTRPAGKPELLSLLPGLTFIDIEWWRAVFGRQFQPLEGSFWTLYVEFKFYFFASVVYFLRGRRYLIGTLIFVSILTLFLKWMAMHAELPLLNVVNGCLRQLSFESFAWFGGGSALYVFVATKRLPYLFVAIAATIVGSLNNYMWDFASGRLMASLSISTFFVASVLSPKLQEIMSWRVLLLVGFISYPLYLIHENLLVAMLVDASHGAATPPWLPIAFLVALGTVAYVIAKYGEPPIRKLIRSLCEPSFRNRLNDLPGS